MTGYAKAHSSFNTFLTPIQYVPVLKKTDNEKKNVNSKEIQLNFVYTFVQSCWKMPVINGNFISKKKGKKNIDYQVCGNTNLLLHNS